MRWKFVSPFLIAGTKLIAVVMAALCLSCLQSYNSSSQDSKRYRSLQGEEKFIAAMKVVYNKCLDCHAYSDYATKADWIASGLVIPGDLENSILFSRLKGSGVGGLEDMPQSGVLSQQELTTIRTWIQTMTP
jgi:hypothetical protein